MSIDHNDEVISSLTFENADLRARLAEMEARLNAQEIHTSFLTELEKIAQENEALRQHLRNQNPASENHQTCERVS